MFEARNKTDLIIEVWEKLDCESVGADEIKAIERVLLDRFGKSAVDPPMVIARLLADEGAVLRHSEIMDLYVKRRSDRPHEPAFRNIVVLDDLAAAEASIRRLENLRRKYAADRSKEGLRLIGEKGREARAEAQQRANDQRNSDSERLMYAEIAEWLTLWMQSPEIFGSWIDLRLSSADFREKFSDSPVRPSA